MTNLGTLLTRHLLALLAGHLATVLPRLVPALLLGHVAALLPGLVPAALTGNLRQRTIYPVLDKLHTKTTQPKAT